tara:strand:- start:1725 stop:2351 length:627 start_codon:yes stop_codon:yes gene_type:complete
MLTKIKLYGQLSEFCGGQKEFEAVVNSTSDAVRFLIANFKGIEKHMATQFYQVTVGGEEVAENELHYPSGGGEIRIIPVVAGAGNAVRIIAGIALIAVALSVPGAGLAVAGQGTALFAPIVSASGVFSAAALAGAVGTALVLGGIAGMLAPTPEVPDEEGDPTKSFSFSGVQQTNRAGTAIPIVYGHVLVGSIPVSAKVDTNDIEVTS